MRVTQQSGYVLHARAWRETSLLLEVFSRDFGRVGLVARAVRGQRARLARSALEPMQALRLDWSGRGELQTLVAVEAEGTLRRLRGDALLAAMYVNELLVRLVARNDPYPRLFDRYARLLDELSRPGSLAWCLRCFEYDLLAAVGYALQLENTADTGVAVDADALYDYLPEHGVLAAGNNPGSVRLRGSALLAMAEGRQPAADDLASLRRLMRTVIGVHVGERGLQSWRVLSGPLRAG